MGSYYRQLVDHPVTASMGLVAGIMTTFGSLPQIILVLRTKSTRDLSYSALIITGGGAALWIVYGILIHDMPLILWDIIAAVLHIILISFKYYYENKKQNLIDHEDNQTLISRTHLGAAYMIQNASHNNNITPNVTRTQS